MMPTIFGLIFLLFLNFGHPAAGLAVVDAGHKLEELHYRVDLGPWSNVARVHLRLTRVGPERFRAEFGGAAQGLWRLLRRWLPESYATEMVLEGGRLKPLVYIEKFENQGHRIQKEFRFNYDRGLLEIWRGRDGQPPAKSGELPLKEPVYDPLSLFYNLRLGAVGPVTPGATLRAAVIPNPQPRHMVFRLGPETAAGSEVMLTVTQPGKEDGPYFILSGPQRVALRAWTRVLVGKLSGELLNPEAVMPVGLPALNQISSPSGAAPEGNK
jgi:hypothetical protein